MNDNIPEWLTAEEDYIVKKGRDNFIDKSTLCILRVLSKIKTTNTYNERYPEATFLKFIFNLFLIILVSSSRNFYFIMLIVAGVLVRLCLFNGNTILKLLKVEICTLLFSSLILAPSAIFMHNLNNCILIIMKIYASTTLMLIFSINTQWNLLSSSLKKIKIPSICIFIFDVTLKYIVLLGNLSLDMLTALKLRSIGVNNKKQKSLSGIIGTTFIKSTEMAAEMYNAMECRGFTGEYKTNSNKIHKHIIVYYLISMIIILNLFIYME